MSNNILVLLRPRLSPGLISPPRLPPPRAIASTEPHPKTAPKRFWRHPLTFQPRAPLPTRPLLTPSAPPLNASPCPRFSRVLPILHPLHSCNAAPASAPPQPRKIDTNRTLRPAPLLRRGTHYPTLHNTQSMTTAAHDPLTRMYTRYPSTASTSISTS